VVECGVEKVSLVWWSVVWCGVVECGVVECGVVWWSVVWCDVVKSFSVRYNSMKRRVYGIICICANVRVHVLTHLDCRIQP
jgi:hypothetical protein